MKKFFLILVISLLFIPIITSAKETQYLFNSSGEWIAFKKGKYVFNVEGEWIGWTGWSNADIADEDGKYLGTITHSNRIYYFFHHPFRVNPGYPGRPNYPGRPSYPGHAGYDPLPSATHDIRIKK